MAPWDDEGFPAARLSALRSTGALGAFARFAPGQSVDDLRHMLRAIGGVDLALGRIFEGHVNAMQLVAVYGDPAQQIMLDEDRRRGCLFGVWNTEPTPGLSILLIGDKRWRLQGAKSFATGAGRLDRVLVTARRADGTKQMVLVDVEGSAQRADNSGWRVRGMRGTISGLFDFSGIELDDRALIGTPGDYEKEPRFSAGAWRFTAVQLGAVEALVRHLRDHLSSTGKAGDAIHRARFAQCATACRSAGLWVRRASERAEAQEPDAIPLVLMTRGIVEDAGFVAMEAAARSVGTAAFFTGQPIDRITRDLGLYLRQPVPDEARDRAAAAWIERDRWGEDAGW